MSNQVQNFLSLNTSEERQAWLRTHLPTKDDEFVKLLREETNHRGRDNPRTALLVIQAVLDAASVWEDNQTQAVAFHLEANIRRLLGEHKDALELYQQAAAHYGSLGMELEAARVAVGQIATMQYLGLYEEALTMADWAGDAFQVAGDHAAMGKMIMNRGNIFARLGRYTEAQESYARAHSIFRAIDNQRYLAVVETNTANVLTHLNDFRQAQVRYQQARTHFEAEGMASTIALIDHNLAHLYLAQGDYQQALATFKQAREIFVTQNDSVKTAYVDLDRSEAYLALNLWHEALELTQNARSTFETADMPLETARLWLLEAATLAHIDEQVSLNTILNKAREIFTRQKNTIWLAVTDLYQGTFDWRKRNLASARDHAYRARSVFWEAQLSTRATQCAIILGEIALLEEDTVVATKCFSQGLSSVTDQNLPEISFACHFGLGRTQQIQGNLIEAQKHYREAILAVERLQAAIGAEDYKIAFLSDKLQVYQSLISLCLNLNTPESTREAFETVEQAKSRTLLDALAREGPVSVSSSAEANLLTELDRIKSELNWYYNRLNAPESNNQGLTREELTQLTDAITEREKTLSELLNQWRSPDLALAPRNPIWTATVAQIQAILPAGTMLLEFYTTDELFIAFGLSSETMWTQQLSVTQGEISDLLGQLRFQINKFSYGPAYRRRHAASLQQSTEDTLHRLYNLLLAPIAEQLTGDTLVIVPHNLLHYVPFHALFDGQRYLIEHKTISYAPSATILHRVLTDPQNKSTKPPLILGLPDEIIPHVADEVKAIGDLFDEATVHLNEEATVENLMTNSKSLPFLHLSTHATFRADNPLFSALKLVDGWVSVNDIYNMISSAPLVTLSACETGGTQVAVGDELVGLCRGFFSAGAKSMVVSLWAVEDSSTAKLMTHFYKNLLGGQPVNQALRTAQLAIKSEYIHPYFWSPFILTGSPQTSLRL